MLQQICFQHLLFSNSAQLGFKPHNRQEHIETDKKRKEIRASTETEKILNEPIYTDDCNLQ